MLVHGGFGSLHNWEGWIPYLTKKYRVISLDLPAHGLTGKIPSNIYSRTTMVETLNLLINMLKVKEFFIAGNSMGGGIALQYALQYPRKIKGIILIGSEGVPNSEEGYDVSMFSDENPVLPTDPSYNKLSRTELFLSKFIGPTVIRTTLNKLIANKELLTPKFINHFERIIRYKGNREANVLMFRQWLDPDADSRDLESQLAKITAPVLYMHGDKDDLVLLEIATIFKEKLPNCELKSYKNSEHMSMIEKPQETANDAIEFINKIINK